MPPNVLLVVMDTARADAFEPYGAPAGSSPAIADLARRGVALERVYSTAHWTVPSHASMFTGLMPRTLGLAQAPDGRPHSCRPLMEAQRERLLPEVMRGAGYATAMLSANVWIQRSSGFDTGFDEVVTLPPRRAHGIGDAGWAGRARFALEVLRARADAGARAAEGMLAQWTSDGARRPFFWFVNLMECHAPYLPPRPWAPLSPPQRLRVGWDMRRHAGLPAIWRDCLGELTVPPDAIARMRDMYARCIRYMDHWVGRVLEALDRARLLEDTVVVVTSDHGENIGENGLRGHAFSLDERLLRVPAVAAGPGLPDAGGLRSLLDLPAIVAGAAGIDHPYGDARPRDHVVAELDGVARIDDPRLPGAVRDLGLDESAVGRLVESMTCATDGRWKVLRRAGGTFVYDLDADPLEARPLALTSAEATAARDRWLPLKEAVEAADDRAEAAPEAAPVLAVDVPDDERAELERQMRLLGYL